MKGRQLTFSILVVSLFLLVGTVSAQADLVANYTREDQHLWGGEIDYYSSYLEAGNWTVVVESDSF